ncbi:hypothetical protein IKS57_06000 [bacterium]|nr:hypothetical protein [bacterium]
MANSISLFKKYIDKLDEVYKQSSLTADLDADSTLVQAGANANEIIIPKLSMDGLGDYSRNDGYVNGDVTLTNETVTFNYERGRKFGVDRQDNAETAGVAFGRLGAEFTRTKATPEMDAFTFAQIASTTGITKTTGTYANGEAWLSALVTAQTNMDNAEVPTESRILYITPDGYNAIHAVDTTKSREVLASFSKIVKVPQTRFYTKITLKDGKTAGQTAGGYAKASNGADINFLIVEKSAVIKYPRILVNKIVSPDDNQTDDKWLFFYRAYGLVDVYDNKLAGVYLSAKTGSASV